MTTTPETVYALDNDHQVSSRHHQALSRLFDPASRGRITGLRNWPTIQRCLELGAGGGAMSWWLAENLPHVNAQVTAADLKPGLVPFHARLSTAAVDITDGGPLGPALGNNWDLIYARMTLLHVRNRETLLHQLAAMLAPGGVLLLEDWGPPPEQRLVCTPTVQAAQLYKRLQVAITDVFHTAGADLTWARRVYPLMLQAGLTEVDTQGWFGFWAGGGPGTDLVCATIAQLRPQLLQAGLTENELDQRIPALLNHPGLVLHGFPMYSTAGTRPE